MSSKILRIYTATDNPAKRLRAPTQILFTLTPVDQSELFKSQTPIAWQIVAFAGYGDAQETVTWHPSIGFSSISVDEHDIITPLLGTRVKVDHMVAFENIAGTLRWSKPRSQNRPDEVVMAKNVTGVPKSFGLCSVSAHPSTGLKFEPLVHFKSTQNGQDVVVSPPVMLQAYAVIGYKQGQLLSSDVQDDFIFQSWDGDAQPINISKLPDDSTWLLYSDHSGEVKLEQQS